MEQCANKWALNNYEREIEKAERENEKYELEFVETISDLKKYVMKLDKLEVLKDVIKEEFNLW